jgi:hypothetical protein
MAERLQINFEYNAIEDRLLMRVSHQESKGSCVEYRAWFTRRFVNVFTEAIDKLIEDGLAGDMQVSPDALEAMKKFQQEAALAKADFSTSYGIDAESCTLFGEVPFLVSVLKVKKKSKNNYVLSFLTSENAGINITADIDLIHSLRQMLLNSARDTGWNQPMSRIAKDDAESFIPPLRVS